MKGKPLPIPTAEEPAEQCRQMGLSVGDVIQGREDATYRVGGFHETRLTVLWLGEFVAVFHEQQRSDLSPEWSRPCEETAWTLDCRRWWKVTQNVELTGAAPKGQQPKIKEIEK